MITDNDKLDLLHSDLQNLQEVLSRIATNQEREIEKMTVLEDLVYDLKSSFKKVLTSAGTSIKTLNCRY